MGNDSSTFRQSAFDDGDSPPPPSLPSLESQVERLGLNSQQKEGLQQVQEVVIPPMYPRSPQTPHLQYLDRFLSLRCAPDLLTLKIFPDAKELTESFSILEALTRFFPLLRAASATAGPEPSFLVVGDGSTPRTAALLAFMYPQSSVYSVDPQLALPSGSSPPGAEPHPNVSNLTLYRGGIEEVVVNDSRVVLVLVHAHVALDACLKSLPKAASVDGIITLPCCNWAEKQAAFQGRKPDREGLDWGCWSEVS